MTFHTRTVKIHRFPVFDMENRRTLTTIRYGNPSSGRKAYIQAGLHADEAPGFLVMHHLIDLLDRADAAKKITGEIVLVPVANPIGTSQWQGDTLLGRYELYDGVNFNRRHLDITDRVAKRIENRLCATAKENIVVIRSAIRKVIKRIQPKSEGEYLKHLLLSLSFDADVVLDLHCDFQAVLHVYTGTPLWPEAADLSAQMGAEATLLCRVSGEHPFDEACSRIWWELAERYPAYPIPPACLAATVELRGQTDVNHELGVKDAGNLFTFLKRRGFIKGSTSAIPSLKNEATPLRGVAYVKAPVPGVVVFLKTPGQPVKKGETLLEIVHPLADNRITPVKSPSSGLLLSTYLDRYARPGRTLALVAGKKPVKNKGNALLAM